MPKGISTDRIRARTDSTTRVPRVPKGIITHSTIRTDRIRARTDRTQCPPGMGPKALGLPEFLTQDQTQVHQPVEGIPDLPLGDGKHRKPVPKQPDKVRRSQTGPGGASNDPTGPTTILGNDPHPEGNLLVAEGLQAGQGSCLVP